MKVAGFGHMALALAVLLLPGIPAGAQTTRAHGSAGVMDFARADPAMNAAMDAARASLSGFLAKAQASDLSSGDYRVKWAHPTDDGGAGTEHIWVTLSAVGPERVEGVLANQPEAFRGAVGDPVSFAKSEISDWMLFRTDGLIEGCYTTRVMISRMKEEERAGFEAQLAPLPTPGTTVKMSAGN